MKGPRFLFIGFALGALVALIFSSGGAFNWAWAAFWFGALLNNEIALYARRRASRRVSLHHTGEA